MNEQEVNWWIVYQALIHAIDSNSGIGFHNRDQGNPAYMAGAHDGTREGLGDSPEQNELFKILVRLSNQYGEPAGTPIRNWREFCERAYRRAHPEILS